MSLSVLETRGFSFRSDNGHMLIYKGSKVIMAADRRQTLYYLKAEVVTRFSNSSERSIADLKLWHTRMGIWEQKG